MPESDDDLGRTEKVMAKGGELIAETRGARQESLGTQLSRMLDTLGKSGNILAALGINLVTAGVGVYIYWALDGVAAFGGAVLAILALLAIVRWVVGI